MRVAEFVEIVDPYIIDDEPILIYGSAPTDNDAETFGIFPENTYVMSVKEKRKKVLLQTESDENGDVILGRMLRAVLNELYDSYPKHELVIQADNIETDKNYMPVFLMGDTLWGNVEVVDYNKFACSGVILAQSSLFDSWHLGFIDQLYTR